MPSRGQSEVWQGSGDAGFSLELRQDLRSGLDLILPARLGGPIVRHSTSQEHLVRHLTDLCCFDARAMETYFYHVGPDGRQTWAANTTFRGGWTRRAILGAGTGVLDELVLYNGRTGDASLWRNSGGERPYFGLERTFDAGTGATAVTGHDRGVLFYSRETGVASLYGRDASLNLVKRAERRLATGGTQVVLGKFATLGAFEVLLYDRQSGIARIYDADLHALPAGRQLVGAGWTQIVAGPWAAASLSHGLESFLLYSGADGRAEVWGHDGQGALNRIREVSAFGRGWTEMVRGDFGLGNLLVYAS
jgi:hypothetical protein